MKNKNVLHKKKNWIFNYEGLLEIQYILVTFSFIMNIFTHGFDMAMSAT